VRGGGDVTDEPFSRRAIALAERALRDGVGEPFGAVAVQDGRMREIGAAAALGRAAYASAFRRVRTRRSKPAA
jgi:hypothetical protein